MDSLCTGVCPTNSETTIRGRSTDLTHKQMSECCSDRNGSLQERRKKKRLSKQSGKTKKPLVLFCSFVRSDAVAQSKEKMKDVKRGFADCSFVSYSFLGRFVALTT